MIQASAMRLHRGKIVLALYVQNEGALSANYGQSVLPKRKEKNHSKNKEENVAVPDTVADC